MKLINQEELNQHNERIIYLLSELNSTLDLYYEKRIDLGLLAMISKSSSKH